MVLDSLAFAVLMGLLADFGDTMNDPWRDFHLDSATITVTVEMTKMLVVGTAPVVTGGDIRLIYSKPAFASNREIRMTPPDRTSAHAIAWGFNNLTREAVGYLAVHEMAGPAGWRIRTTTFQPVNTRREEEMRWSLVHGIL